MSKINDGGPAFPQTGCALPPNVPYSGMSKREVLAGMAMQGFAANADLNSLLDSTVQSASVRWADALISELGKGKA
jgi:hypothetical protein